MKFDKVALVSVVFAMVFNVFAGEGFAQILLKDIRYESFEPIVVAENKTAESDEGKTEDNSEKKSGNEEKRKSKVKIWAGYNWYKMDNFNEKLSRENNTGIDGGFAAGFEVTHIKLSKEIPVVKEKISLTLPIFGVELLSASSETTHFLPTEPFSVTAKWELPVLGAYIAPEIDFFKEKSFQLYWRPIGVGYYKIGELFDAKLSVSDRPGTLELSGDTIGFLSQVGIKYVTDEKDYGYELFTELGYRMLRFTDVSLQPTGDFSGTWDGDPVRPGILTETLDYSGFIIKGGVSFKF